MKNRRYLLALCFIALLSFAFSFKVSAATTTTLRLAGQDRYKTSVEISKTGWFSADTAVLATGENFPDALCSAPLAKQLNAPILLTERNILNSDTERELSRLRVKKVFIVGGPGVVSEYVESQLRAKGIECIRLFGSDRYQTSLKVANYLSNNFKMAKEIAVATGVDFPDALSISPIAASIGMPVILVPKDYLQTGLDDYIKNNLISKTYVVGGNDIISDSVAYKLPGIERIYGNDKYERNANVLNKFSQHINFFSVYIATGEDFPDALAGSALAPIASAPIVLTGKNPTDSTRNVIGANLIKINYMKALGGEAVVSESSIMDLLYNSSRNLKVHFLNVGRADSILIQTPNGSNMLVDAGNNGDGDSIVSYLRTHGINTLDAVVNTYPAEEHVGGMDTIIKSFTIGKVYAPKLTTFNKSYRDFAYALSSKNLTVTNPLPGDRIEIDPNVRIEVLAPTEENYDKLINHSIVLKVTYGDKSFLLTGDAGRVSEDEILNKGYNVSATVLKLGNHGSYESTSSAFLDKVKPQYAIISTGSGSNIQPPDSSILYNFEKMGTKVYSTAGSGTIIFTTNGMNISFNTIPGSIIGSAGTNSEISASVYKSGNVQYPTIRLVVTGPYGGEITSVFHYRTRDLTHTGSINENNEGIIPIDDNEELNYVLNIDITVTLNGKIYTTRAQLMP